MPQTGKNETKSVDASNNMSSNIIKESTGSSSVPVEDSSSMFNFGASSSLLPARPDNNNNDEEDDKGDGSNEKGSENSNNNNSYVYPVTSFPPISAFEVSTEFPALILPVRRTHEVRKKLKSIMLSRPQLSVVVELSDKDLDLNSNNESNNKLKLLNDNRKDYRKIVLDPQQAGLDNKNDNDNDDTKTVKMNDVLKSLLEEEPQSFRLGSHTIVLSYQDWTVEEILGRLLLPEGVKEVPSAFEAVGHLAHVNLRDELLPYKYLVGKVFLDKNSPRIQTVVNKLGSIDNKYRTFGMEVIAGNDDGNSNWSDVLVKEEGCEYRLDFRKVYWNSRLGGEHRRLVKLIQKDASARANGGDNSNDKGMQDTQKKSLVVADLMAGIGPFAIPLTARTQGSNSNTKPEGTGEKKKKKNNNKTKTNATPKTASLPIEMYANDLNPSSYEYLVVNAKRNKCDFISNDNSANDDSKGNKNYKLHVYNLDARAFCHQLQDRGIRPDHCIMNLPATALEFLDAFRGYPRSSHTEDDDDDDLPRIHVHCFAPKDLQDAQREIWKRAETALGCSLDENADRVTIHPVRDVSPNKNMYCVSFRLPKAISALPRIQIDVDEQQPQQQQGNDGKAEPDSKRRKTDV